MQHWQSFSVTRHMRRTNSADSPQERVDESVEQFLLVIQEGSFGMRTSSHATKS